MIKKVSRRYEEEGRWFESVCGLVKEERMTSKLALGTTFGSVTSSSGSAQVIASSSTQKK